MKRVVKCFLIASLFFIAFNLKAQSDYLTKSDVRVRSGPGAKYKSLGVIKTGERIIVIDTSNLSWYKIEYKSKFGFLSSKLLSPVFETSLAEQMAKQQEKKVVSESGQTKPNTTTPYIALVLILVILVFVIASSKAKKRKVDRGPIFVPKQPSTVIKQIIPKKPIPLENQNKDRNIPHIQSIASSEPDNAGFMVNQNEVREEDSVIDVTAEKFILPKDVAINISTNSIRETDYNFINQYWGLGTKYKSKLKLTDDEVKILDSLIDTDNKFNSIEFVAIELIRLFFDILNHLGDEFILAGSSIQEQTNVIAEIELTQRYKLWKNSQSYINQLPGFTNIINQVIYKIGENSLRDHFGIGRKTDLKYYIYSEEALAAFNERFNKVIQKYISNHLLVMKVCDELTEIQLNDYTKSRWKNKLELLKTNCEKSGYSDFYEQILVLGRQNKNNPSVENIFFDASKFISKFDKITALKLYGYYVYYDLQSATFDNKQLTKNIQKSLFNTDIQLQEFEFIINKFIEDKNIDKAIESISNIYTPKRKKIQLDSSKIKEVREKHSDTVELLNEYLKDEEEGTGHDLVLKGQNEVELVINYGKLDESPSIYKESQRLSAIQKETLNLFSKRGFVLSMNEFDTFVKSKGVFKNSLIESINEIYFELLDDILIEENEEAISLTETYYSKIIN